MALNAPRDTDIGWVLDEVLGIPETRHAILLSADGLLTLDDRYAILADLQYLLATNDQEQS